MRLICSSLLIAVWASFAPAAEQPVYKREEIENFWRHLNAVLDAEEARRPQQKQRANLRYPIPKSYPFEALNHLRADDLVRAAKEGIREARLRTQNRTRAEGDRMALAAVTRCLEYYPLLARDEKDLRPLLYAMEEPREDWVLRVFLLERIAPGLAPESLFSDWFIEEIGRDPREVNRILGKILSLMADAPEVQAAAIRGAYALHLDQYRRALATDAALAAKAAEASLALEPGIELNTPGYEVSLDLDLRLKQVKGNFDGLANMLGLYIDPRKAMPEHLQQLAKEYLRKMLDEIPVPDAGKLQAMLDAPGSVAAPPRPSNPLAMPPMLRGAPEIPGAPGLGAAPVTPGAPVTITLPAPATGSLAPLFKETGPQTGAAPTEPAPVEPAPAPTEPAQVEPAPAPTEPAQVEPAAVPTEPAPAEPAAAPATAP